jgi:folate-dependent tRNA-U54 methylase TrmFO/GidA
MQEPPLIYLHEDPAPTAEELDAHCAYWADLFDRMGPDNFNGTREKERARHLVQSLASTRISAPYSFRYSKEFEQQMNQADISRRRRIQRSRAPDD